MNRACTSETGNGLKTAFKRVVGDLGGIEAAASCTRVNRSTISDYGNVDSEKMVPVDVVLDLELVAGHAHVTAALARAQGFELRSLAVRPVPELAACLARLAQDNGKLMAKAAYALSGKASARERAAMVEDLCDMNQALHEALLCLKAEDRQA